MDEWNAWRHRKVGGFISAGVRSVDTPDAVTVLRVTMRCSSWPGALLPPHALTLLHPDPDGYIIEVGQSPELKYG